MINSKKTRQETLEWLCLQSAKGRSAIYFVDCVDINQFHQSLRNSYEQAFNQIVQRFGIRPYLMGHRSYVNDGYVTFMLPIWYGAACEHTNIVAVENPHKLSARMLAEIQMIPAPYKHWQPKLLGIKLLGAK
jgi:hypothetical protein